VAINFTEFTTEVARVGGLGTSTDDGTSATAWAKGGLRMICRAAAFPWLRVAWELTLVEGTYNYAFSGISAVLWRIDAQSLRYGGKGCELVWGSVAAIDAALGPNWKDSDAGNVTPQYAARFGADLWIAGKPSAAHIAAHPKIMGYGWQQENFAKTATINSGNLLLPDEFIEIAVECALAFGFTEEDDPRAEVKMSMATKLIREDIMGCRLDVGTGDRMLPPDWAYHQYDGVSDYGDGAA
jgi:hypothetical protein